MEGTDSAASFELINQRLDWIEENLRRVEGLQYVPMGREGHRPDETPIPPEVQELVQQGKTKEAIAAYRKATGVDFTHAQRALDKLAQ